MTAAAPAWVWGGKARPTSRIWAPTRCAQALVTAYCRRRVARSAAGRPSAMKLALRSRSSSIACARPVTCWPGAASCAERPKLAALLAAAATRRPAEAIAMTVGMAIKAISRHGTRQFRSASREPLRLAVNPVPAAMSAPHERLDVERLLELPVVQHQVGGPLDLHRVGAGGERPGGHDAGDVRAQVQRGRQDLLEDRQVRGGDRVSLLDRLGERRRRARVPGRPGAVHSV